MQSVFEDPFFNEKCLVLDELRLICKNVYYSSANKQYILGFRLIVLAFRDTKQTFQLCLVDEQY